jgi:hypothetical protein
MCYTTNDLEVIRVTLVAADGRPVHDSLVRPERFSGISESNLIKHETGSLYDVQNDLMNLINAKTILVGHGFENDLRFLLFNFVLQVMLTAFISYSVVNSSVFIVQFLLRMNEQPVLSSKL